MSQAYPDFHFDRRELVVNGRRMSCVDQRPTADVPAEPVVMLHGNPSWSFYYRRLIAELADRYRCVAPDHVGMGLSEKPAHPAYPFTLERRIDDVAGLLEQLGIDGRITLVLHDWGGMIGMGYAVRHPEKIARLVVLNTAAFGLPLGKAMPWTISVARAPLIGPLAVKGLNLFAWGAAVYGVTERPMPTPIRKAYLAPYDRWAHREGVYRFVRDIPLKVGHPSYATMQHVAENLDQFTDRPMLIGWGMGDFVFDRFFLEQWTQRFPQAEVERYDKAGHYVLEDAGDRLAPRVRAFLENHPV